MTTPSDPAAVRGRAEALALEAGLRHVAVWATELADMLGQQFWAGAVQPDLRKHAGALIRLVEKEEERATRLGKNPDS